ncbi:AsmA-like C-terminal region-containing protein [Crocinitomicaceae bacterium]|nr:AsmA-like C-terminal region-containing protein [Crocinitomicaceae bacterium]
MKKKALRIAKWTFGILFGIFLTVSILIFVLKDTIIETSIAEINKNLEVPMEVGDVELAFWSSFPNISIDLLNVEIPSRNTSTSLLKSKKFNLRFNPFDLAMGDYNLKQINISDGELNLYVDSLGGDNYNIVKSSEENDDSEFKLELQAVTLKSMKVSYLNDITHQEYHSNFNRVNLTGELSTDEFEMLTSGQILLNSAKSSGVTLVKNQEIEFSLKVNVNQKKLITSLPMAQIQIGGLPFNINGVIDKDSMRFHIASNSILLTDAVEKFSVDSDNHLKNLSGNGLLDFDLTVNGGTKSTDPIDIACNFSIKDGEIIEPTEKIKLNNIQLLGHYTKRDSTLEELVLTDVRFDSETGPFTGNLSVVDFENPQLKGFAKGTINLNAAHRILHLPEFENINGHLKVYCDFEAVQNQNSELQLKRCSGDVTIVNSNFKLENDKRAFKSVNGNLKFTRRDVRVNQFSLIVDQSDLNLSGSFSNVFNYLYNSGTLAMNLNVKGERVLLEDLGSTTKAEKIENGEIFALPDNLKGDVRIALTKIEYGGHQYENLSGNMNIKNRKVRFSNLSLKNAGATVRGSLSIYEKQPEIFEFKTQLRSYNLDVKSAFKEWNNFYQDVILAKNISGRASLTLALNADFSLDKGINYPSIDSKMNIEINNGTLKNSLLMKDIAESVKDSPAKLALGKKNLKLLEKRLNEISFSTLKNEITIKNETVNIPKMNISSSALNMNVSGTHEFSNQVDYRFDFKFRDLLTNDRDSEFGEIIDDGSGFRMFLKMTGDIYEPTLEWDREQQKQSAKEYRQEEKKQIKEMLKTEFGVFKNDTTVKEYKEEEAPKEEIKIDWNPTTGGEEKESEQEKEKEKPKKKESKLKKALERLKQQQKKEEEEQEEFIGIQGGG